MTTLVVGASGQLGTAVTRSLVERGRRVRAFVRTTSTHRHLAGDPRIERAFGDLRDPGSVDAACKGVDVLIATANAIGPGAGGGGLAEVDGEGYRHLVEAARRNGVRQFVFASVPVTPHDARSLQFSLKRLNERRIEESGLHYTIVRFGMFADVWPALLGSGLPQRGAENPSLARPFWFSRLFQTTAGELIERNGLALVPGPGSVASSFITIQDAARILAATPGHAEAKDVVIEVGGPEVLTFDQVLEIFERVLGRRVRGLFTPPVVFHALALLLRPFSRPAASVMEVNRLTARGSVPAFDPDRSVTIARRFGVERLTGLEEFLREKAALPAA